MGKTPFVPMGREQSASLNLAVMVNHVPATVALVTILVVVPGIM